ncbi:MULTISPECIES: ABC transporter substrate-binding protein [Comamonas]|jgi:branched-chain amino acid transport system substrate-binding protein|uniref:ABC transporter permease n=5 Tax=Comamonas aquatica TaxID=225991 RepID=A0A014MAN0_9BURK|nr:ABC transporter permease [Comamonas aquatica]EXU78801.1 ABC transporter permease [Comamonas aquatica DA1877]MRT21756.1 ABC transporter substrate-binding protein [Comamonas sp. CAH-2]CAB5653462.1 urea ABC transporter, urea binding protein [Comamonas aquatica]CAB5668008.1 urea ABC transporter, urea binding protein [Comamonas aquatica]
MRHALSPLVLALCGMGLWSAAAQAQTFKEPDTVKIGFITDMSSLYADVEGKNGAVAIQMAIDDFGGKLLGKPIELLTADHQNKADIAASKAREWIDQQDISLVFGGTNSATALAMAKVAQEKKRIFVDNGAGSSALTNEQCSPYTVHYAFDTVALAKGTGKAVVEAGGKSWFFLTADYAFGHALEADTSKIVEANGGKVVGAVRTPLNASDFSSFMLQAQNSKAQILGLANAGGDTINSIKAAREFGVTKGMKLAGLLIFFSDIHSLGVKNTEGLQFTTSWYWDMNDESRKFADKFMAKTKRRPSEIQAADYSATMTWLQAAQRAGTLEADKVMAEWKSKPIKDFFGEGVIRPDGRYAHDMYLMEVKSPAESKGTWDYYKLVKKLPADQVWTTKAESKCQYWK